MGGKSRKAVTVSREFIDRLKALKEAKGMGLKVSARKSTPKKPVDTGGGLL
jgi:hypothetical protein